ncbi:hypothetical protein RND71_011995 [Anisodus tanguticus]|uniref:Uncharacterized protein n=1 Tax=Anisodus tanguticus TaxID=243964 RepID=A0AAE1SCF4_9SOLA|nr:hypothetical protein RND71_011995 [Anisodus tanguticus]
MGVLFTLPTITAITYNSQGSISDDELIERVTELAVLVQNSRDILTDKDSLQEAMSKFPGFPCSGLESQIAYSGGEVVGQFLRDKDKKSRRQTRETRFILGKVILDTIAPGVIPGSEVIRHTLVKVDAQLSKDATEENIGGSVEFKKRKFVCEDDNQPNTSYEIKHNRAEKRKSVIAKQSKE